MNLKAAIALIETYRAWFIERRFAGQFEASCQRIDRGPYSHARRLLPLRPHQSNGRNPPTEGRQLIPEGTAARCAARID